MSDGPSRAHRMRERLAQRREEHAERSRVYRLLFALAGLIVTVAGLAMLVLPGPAFVVIPIGLAMLAMEFAWAERMLDRALAHAEVAQQKAKETTRAQRVLAGIAVALGVAAAIAAVLLWDIPVLPDG
jgi:uncharacterized protein (TIGR02611 family)